MRYGLIGEHLGHSYSSEIHEAVAHKPYELIELPPDALESFMKSREFCGINVTIPYKTAVMPYLDEISDAAKSIGAVNTVVNRDGKLYGYNTDFVGMRALIRRAGISVMGKKVLILGTGGTSKTAFSVMQALGAKQIVFVSRQPRSGVVSYEEASVTHRDAEIIVNTTPVGMFPNEGNIPIDLSVFPNLSGVLDAIYHPLRTNLVLAARRRGIPAAGGLYMLCAQAVEAIEYFHGIKAETAVTDAVYAQLYRQKENIVLIGMPTCGKTTVGKRIAEYINKPFLDTDTLITEKIGEPIPDYICRFGEVAFRDAESSVIGEIAQKSGYVIATGGGAVLREENVQALKRNGRLVLLDRSLEKLSALPDRPLSDDPQKLARLFETRAPIYRGAADVIVSADEIPETVAQTVLRELEKDVSA